MSSSSLLEKTFEDFAAAFVGQIPTDFAPIDSLINKKTVGFSLPLANEKQNIGNPNLYYDIVRLPHSLAVLVCLQIHYSDGADVHSLAAKFAALSDKLEVETKSDIYFALRTGKPENEAPKGICIKYKEEFTLNKSANNATTIEKVKGALLYLSKKIGTKVTTILPNLHPLNQILYGAPGTGKTYNTINHALAIIENKPIAEYDNTNRADLKKTFDDYVENGQIAFVTFHQSLSYEDFIEGLKPKSEGNNISYAVEDGIFKQMAKKAAHTPINNYVLIIDEINRGNVAQIFGELITLIEPSKRQDAAEAINLTLPYSKEAFGVPQNLYIIGTMNTADRSVEALDTALRRRFDFVEMQPKPEILAGKMSEICLSTVLTNLNARIAYLLDSDHAIGHAYFMDVDNADKLAQVFEHKIVPLLREYFYNDYEKIQMILGEDFVESKLKSDIPKFAGGKTAKERRIYEFQQVKADKIIAALKTASLDE